MPTTSARCSPGRSRPRPSSSGRYELAHQPEVPYRAVINEAVELAKSYGGTDGYKFVNGVLDKLAAQLRSAEKA
jgi:N utilization substance protein B